MAATLILAAILGILWIVWWLGGLSRTQRLVAKVPGPWRLPILGHIHHLPYDAKEFYTKIRQLCGEMKHHELFRIEIGPTRRMVILTRAEMVEKLLSSQVHLRKSAEYDPVIPWLGTGLLTSTGDKWRTRRRLLTPAFHFRILQDFLEVFNEQADVFVEKLKHRVDQPAFDIFPGITLCTLDIICETAMGKHADTQTDENSEYAEAVAKIAELITVRQKRPWLWPDIIYNNIPAGREHAKCLQILHGYTDDVINERRALFEAEHGKSGEVSDDPSSLYGGKKKLAFLDLLLQTAKESGLSHLDIREEVDTFMFEGHDTTAGGIGWAIHLIGRHPDVQEKLHAEVDAVFGGSTRSVTSADLKELKYLESVIKETLRLFPSVPMFGRHLEDDLQLGQYLCPAGTSALVVTTELHRDPRYFPAPEKFDPERFTIENSAGRHPYAYVPFSAGPRNCIGQKFALNEEKVILSSILRHFHITSVHKTEDMSPKGELILRPGKGVWVQLTHRKLTL